MICPIPDSNGFPEPDGALTERWTDEARAGALAARRTGSKYKTKKDKERDRQKGDNPTFADRGEQSGVAAHVQARTAAHAAARTGAQADYKRISDERAAKKAKEEAEAKKKASGGGKADAKPKRTGEETDDKGNRVIKYSDGSTVTVGKDGSAIRKKPDGTEVKGKYKDPTPKGEPDPEGFKGETQSDRDRAAKKAESDRKKTEREKAKGSKTTKSTFYRAKLSRTKKGPIAGTGGRYA